MTRRRALEYNRHLVSAQEGKKPMHWLTIIVVSYSIHIDHNLMKLRTTFHRVVNISLKWSVLCCCFLKRPKNPLPILSFSLAKQVTAPFSFNWVTKQPRWWYWLLCHMYVRNYIWQITCTTSRDMKSVYFSFRVTCAIRSTAARGTFYRKFGIAAGLLEGWV